jgi:hypothetical protein
MHAGNDTDTAVQLSGLVLPSMAAILIMVPRVWTVEAAESILSFFAVVIRGAGACTF